MISILLLGLAAAASEPIVVVDEDQPTIVIPLAKYDLARDEDVRRLKHRISSAAMTVCDRSYRGVSYLETVECVKTARSAANSELDALLSKRSAGIAMTAIAVAPRP